MGLNDELILSNYESEFVKYENKMSSQNQNDVYSLSSTSQVTIWNQKPGEHDHFTTDKPVDFIPIRPASATEEKLIKAAQTDKNNNKSPKKPGLSGIFPFKIPGMFYFKKPKDNTVTSNIGNLSETTETDETDEITKTMKTTETAETKAKSRNNIDSTIRDSTVENYDNVRKYLEANKGLEETSTSTSGGGGYSYGAGIPVYYAVPKNNNSDELNIVTGAAISGVTVAGGPAVRYIIIYLDEDEKKEKDKPVATIKTITTKSSSFDGDKFITKTDNGKEYITIYTEGKYITKTSTGNEYITRAVNDEEYITKSISGEEYITIVKTITAENITTTTTTSTSKDDKEYITQSKSVNGKGKGQVEYIIITSSSENSRNITKEVQITNTETITNTVADENGNVTVIVTVIETYENGAATITVTTTKKDPKGNVIDTYTEKKTRTSMTPKKKQIESLTISEMDENGIATEINKEIETDDDGNITTKITTTKKDLSGNVLETNTEIIHGVAEYVTEPEETIITASVENGIIRETETRTRTDKDGNTITKVITTKKDPSGNVLETNTEIIHGVAEYVTEPEETIITTSMENGIIRETKTIKETDENGNIITKVITTKKDSSGKVLETYTEIIHG
jgi:hypothetical protein